MPAKNKMVPDFVILFNLDGRPKRLDYQQIPFAGWSELKRQLGITPRGLTQAVLDFDVEAIAAVIWLERKQRERRLPFGDVLKELRADEPEFEFDRLIIDGEDTYGAADDEDGDGDVEDPPGGAATGVTPT